MTNKEMGEILNSMVILVDTREQKNQHITDYFDKNGIKWKNKKLDSGDYSFELTGKYADLTETVCIEKKNSLSEIAGNFTSGRERFVREFERAENNKRQMFILVENATWKKVSNGSYRSQITPNSMTASLLSFSFKYNTPIFFVGKDESPMLIYKILYYFLREILKKA